MTTIVGWNVEGLVKSFALADQTPLDLKITTEASEERVGGEAVVVGHESDFDLTRHTVTAYLLVEEAARPGLQVPVYYHEEVSVELADLAKVLD